MGRVGTRSGKGCCIKEGGAPSQPSQPAPPPPPAYALRPRKRELSQPTPPPASSRRRAAVVTSTGSGGSIVSSYSGGGNNRRSKKEAAAAATSSRRGRKRQEPLQTEEERKVIITAIEDRAKKSAAAYYPTYLDILAEEPAQLALEYYKNKEGARLELTKMINGRDHLTFPLGIVTHIQFKALRFDPSDGAPSPTTVYAQIHWNSFSSGFKRHASRVFTRDSPLLEDPSFKVDPTDGWIDYPFDCPECELDGKKVLRPSKQKQI